MKVLLGTIARMLCIILLILPTLAQRRPPSPPPPRRPPSPPPRRPPSPPPPPPRRPPSPPPPPPPPPPRRPPPPPPRSPPPPPYTKLTWTLDYDPETYSTFINSLRTAFIPFGKVCEIPVTPKSPKPNDAFILVDVINSNEKIITLAFRTSNVYFVGFMDELNGAFRANFVKDDFNELEKSNLFSDAEIRSKLPHGGGYDNLVSVANLKSRQELDLGIISFSSYIDMVYGSDYNGKDKPKDIGQNLAKFALKAIQMIAEATRFKYIEDRVEKQGMYDSFKPDDTFIKLENNWGTISESIHRSSPDCKPVKSPSFPQWPDIKEQVGLLKHPDKVVLGDDVPFMEGIFGSNDNADDVALEFIM